MLVHPADLDDALCTTALASSASEGGTQLPFAVDDALLQGGGGELWAVRRPMLCPRARSYSDTGRVVRRS